MLARLRRLLTRSESAGASWERTYPFVYVEVDGTARELHADERTYLETEFEGGDGNRPYIKSTYQDRDGRGRLSGYLYRSQLPSDKSVKSAPLDDPNKPFSRDE